MCENDLICGFSAGAYTQTHKIIRRRGRGDLAPNEKSLIVSARSLVYAALSCSLAPKYDDGAHFLANRKHAVWLRKRRRV